MRISTQFSKFKNNHSKSFQINKICFNVYIVLFLFIKFALFFPREELSRCLTILFNYVELVAIF